MILVKNELKNPRVAADFFFSFLNELQWQDSSQSPKRISLKHEILISDPVKRLKAKRRKVSLGTMRASCKHTMQAFRHQEERKRERVRFLKIDPKIKRSSTAE